MKTQDRVMFVDDEEALLAGWHRFLSDRGLEVTTARDGESAIAKLRNKPAHVVVSDLRMPKAGGLELLEWVHQQQPDTPFILMTGYGNEAVERRARELGAFDYLDKPVAPETLGASINAALQMGLVPATASVGTAALPSVAAVPQEVQLVAEEAAATSARAMDVLRTIGALMAAPLLGLAFVIFLPFAGFVALLGILARSVRDAIAPTAGREMKDGETHGDPFP